MLVAALLRRLFAKAISASISARDCTCSCQEEIIFCCCLHAFTQNDNLLYQITHLPRRETRHEVSFELILSHF